MKADAIRRARQMHSRTVYSAPAPPAIENLEKNKKEEQPKARQNVSPEGVLQLTRMLGISSDQAILFALILLLSQSKENIPLVIALLYIAM